MSQIQVDRGKVVLITAVGVLETVVLIGIVWSLIGVPSLAVGVLFVVFWGYLLTEKFEDEDEKFEDIIDQELLHIAIDNRDLTTINQLISHLKNEVLSTENDECGTYIRIMNRADRQKIQQLLSDLEVKRAAIEIDLKLEEGLLEGSHYLEGS